MDLIKLSADHSKIIFNDKSQLIWGAITQKESKEAITNSFLFYLFCEQKITEFTSRQVKNRNIIDAESCII